MKTPFKPLQGYVICKPYVDKDDTFVSTKETAGECQLSEVLSVGIDYVDDHGNTRTTDVKEKDIILHRYTSDDFTIKFDRFRIVHFSNIFAVKNGQ